MILVVKPLLILGLILLLGGIQFITIGIVADINTRTYFESQNKKTYNVRKVYHAKREIEHTSEVPCNCYINISFILNKPVIEFFQPVF